MGLDNGIIIRGFSEEDASYFVEPTSYSDSDSNKIDLEICYWRKCWHVRSAIMEVLHMSDEEYEKKIDKEDIPALIRALMTLMSKETWEEGGETIWTFEQYASTHLDNIINLRLLDKYMETHPDIEVVFYDSY